MAATAFALIGPDQGAGQAPEDPLPAELRRFAAERPLRIGWFRGGEPVSVWQGDVVAGGYAVEEWNLLAIKLSLSLEHVPFDDIGSVVTALQEGTIDVAGGLGNRPDAQAFAASTEPLAFERITFVGAPDQAGRPLGTLEDRTVTSIPGSPLVLALLSRYPNTTYVPTQDITQGLRAVADGRIDLYLAPLGVAGYAMRQQELQLVPVGDTIQTAPVSAWAVQGSTALALAQAARGQLTDAEMSLATLRWTGFDLGPNTNGGTPTWVGRLLLVALALALVFGVFALVLRRQVRVATSALSELNAQLEARVAARTHDLDLAVTRLERSNEALSAFAHTIAHDLRGPVGAIAGFAELLRGDRLAGDDRDELLGAMASSSKRLVAMVDGLLQDAARVGARSTHMTVNAFTSWLPEVLGPEVQRAGAVLHVAVDLDDPQAPIGLDSIVLQRTAINLAGNALKYGTPPDGAEPRVEVRLAPSDPDGWLLEVDDNGPGVPVELRERVFELGFRAQHDARGHGLGLAETRELVERAGGTITIGDSPLGGARFTVTVPA